MTERHHDVDNRRAAGHMFTLASNGSGSVVVAALAFMLLATTQACQRQDTAQGPGAASSEAAGASSPMSRTELAWFRQQYGPNHYSEREEEWLVRDYFQDRKGGTFVDVGANHYKAASKTYYLESKLGWSGIAVEPQQEFADEYRKYRPLTRFLPFFVSDRSNHTARLYLRGRKDQVASSDEDFVRSFGAPEEVRDVPTMTLNDLLEAEKIQRIDFLSMDIELHEPKALQGFDIGRFKPALVCVEGLLPVRQQILDYFAEHDYVLVGKYMWVDLENLYFEPLAARGGAE